MHFSPYDFDNMTNMEIIDESNMTNDKNTKNLTTLSADTGYENPSFQHLNDSNDSNHSRTPSEVVVLRSKFNSQHEFGSMSDLTEQRLSTFRKNKLNDSISTTNVQGSNNGKRYQESSNAESIIETIRNSSIYSMYSPPLGDSNNISYSPGKGPTSKKPAVPSRPSSIFYGIFLRQFLYSSLILKF